MKGRGPGSRVRKGPVKGSWFEGGRDSASSGAVWRREVKRRQRESRVVFVWRPRVAGRTLCFSPPSPFPCSRSLILFPLLFFPPSPPSLHPFPSPSCCLSLLPSPVKLLENTFFFSLPLSLSLASRQCAEETGNSCRARKQQSTCTCVIASRPAIT